MGTECEFVPLLVSIKCQWSLGPPEAQDLCSAMKAKAIACDLKKAFCLLIVLGSEGSSKIEPSQYEEVSKELIHGIAAKAIFVPDDDEFGLSDAFNAMTPNAKVNSELFSSHSFLMAHGGNQGRDRDELDAGNALRERPLQVLVEKFRSLREVLTGKN